MPNIISTTVDRRRGKYYQIGGYMPNIISTTVDYPQTMPQLSLGYMPNIISTTVDGYGCGRYCGEAICLI